MRNYNLTPEGLDRLRQSILARRPWEQSTGPTTADGKAASRWNAWKHGGRAEELLPDEIKQVLEVLREGGDIEAIAGPLLKATAASVPEGMFLNGARLFSWRDRLMVRRLAQGLPGFDTRLGLY